MKIELKTAITPKAFLGFVGFIIMQFIMYINSKQTGWDLAIMILNIVFATILMILGIDNPSVTKFFKDLGVVMMDFRGSPSLNCKKSNRYGNLSLYFG